MKKLFVLLTATALSILGPAAGASDWDKTWGEILAAARVEGRVVVAGPPSMELRRTMPAAFMERYGIVIEYIGGRSSELATRLRAERRSDIHSLDVVFAGNESMAMVFHREAMLQPLKSVLLLPEVTDAKKWKKGKLWFSDPEDQYILRLSNTITTMFHINTREVKPDELRSVKDLLNPKWKGKIALQDPTISGSGSNQAAHLFYQHGDAFVKALYVDQKPMISRDTRQITDGLARGAFAITLGAEDADVAKLKSEGLPLSLLENLTDLYGQVSASFGQVGLINTAPHPNAARIFLNWIASKEGGEVFNRAMGTASTRNDVDESFLPPEIIPKQDKQYFDTYDWDFTTTKKEAVRLKMKELLQGR